MRITRLTLCVLAALRRVTPLRLAPRWQPALRLGRRLSRKSVAVDVAPEPPAELEKIKAAPRASKAQWSQLANLVRKDWPLLGAASVALTAAALADVAVPHFSSGALTAVVAKDQARVRVQLRGLALSSLASATFTGVRGGLFWLAGTRVVTRLRLALFGAMLRQEVGFFDAVSTVSYTHLTLPTIPLV